MSLNTTARTVPPAQAASSNTQRDALSAVNALLGSGSSPDIFVEAGETLAKLGMLSEAAEAFRHAADRGGPHAQASALRAATLFFEAGDDDQALLYAMQLYKTMPDSPDVAFILATLFARTEDWPLVNLVKNTLVKSDKPEHLKLAADLIGDDVRNEHNLTLFKKLRALYPHDTHIRFSLLGFAREFCDFDVLDTEETQLEAELVIAGGDVLAAESPHRNLMWCGDERLNRRALNVRGLAAAPRFNPQRRVKLHRWSDRLRIGYLSNDLWDDHATMRLFQGVLTAHDPDRFEVTLFCYTPEQFIGFDSGNRKTWGRIVPIGRLNDADAEAAIRACEIDILVDLKGHTGGARPGILNRMAAPVQVAWLGFPGSGTGIDCDYVIGDTTVLPESSKTHYHEKFCRLPDTYQPNDPVHRPLPTAGSRANLGLPEDAFVFAAFNSARKISRATIALWIRILQGAASSVIWIMCDSPIARDNILRRIRSGGIEPARIIFAPKMAYASHVARLQAADLGLDTFPYNGHTTTSDKLWAGLPVVTARGSNFASRVSESLLKAAGLPGLIADDHDAFCDLAIALANDRERVAIMKRHLTETRYSTPLFDVQRFCRHLECAFETMAERARDGLAPDHFDVPALTAL